MVVNKCIYEHVFTSLFRPLPKKCSSGVDGSSAVGAKNNHRRGLLQTIDTHTEDKMQVFKKFLSRIYYYLFLWKFVKWMCFDPHNLCHKLDITQCVHWVFFFDCYIINLSNKVEIFWLKTSLSRLQEVFSLRNKYFCPDWIQEKQLCKTNLDGVGPIYDRPTID